MESAPTMPDRPQPITPADRSAAASEALACAAAQLLDVAQSDDPPPATLERDSDGIWQLKPWQLVQVAAWLNARADLYRVTR